MKKSKVSKEKVEATEALKNAVIDYLFYYNVSDLLGEISSNLPLKDAKQWADALENELSYHQKGVCIVKPRTEKQQTQIDEMLESIFGSVNEKESQCLTLF